MDKKYMCRNRYTDIVTYNKTRVKLQAGVGKPASSPIAEYINACYVNSPFDKVGAGQYNGDAKIIATQGPLPETTDHFWQMIVE